MRPRGFALILAASCATFDAARTPDDAGGGDAGASDSAAPDASAPDRAAPPTLERGEPMSCGFTPFDDGFERNDVQGPWSEDHVNNEAPITLVTSDLQAAHGEKSLLVDVPASTKSSGGHYLVLATPAMGAEPPACIEVHEYVLVESLSGTARPLTIHFATKLLYVRLDAVSTSNALAVELREQILAYPDGGKASGSDSIATSGTVAMGRWIDIGIRFEKSTSTPAATLFVDGTPVTSSALQLITADDDVVDVQAGCSYIDSSDSARYFIDDFSLR